MAAVYGDISNQHVDYGRRRIQWIKVRDAIEGEDRVKEKGVRYLPKPEAMTYPAYNGYKERAVFYPVAERTLRGMTGMVFRINPIVEGDNMMLDHIDDITTDDDTFSVLAQEALQEVLSMGRYGMLVDYPMQASVTDLPCIITYKTEEIIDWQQEHVGNKKMLTRVVVRDRIDNPNHNDSTRYLELLLVNGMYEVRVWNRDAPTMAPGRPSYVHTETIQPTVQGRRLNFIPFFFVGPYNLRPEVSKPPMLDLVTMNYGHYRNSADYEASLFLTSQPTYYIAGTLDEGNKPDTIGAGTIWYLPQDAKADMLEFTGEGIKAQKEAMQEKEQRMASLGARMIHDGKNRNETSDTARMRGKGELSLVTSSVSMVSESLTQVLKTVCDFAGIDSAMTRVELNRDWIEARMDPEELTALIAGWQAGAYSYDTLFSNLQRGEIIDVARRPEDEKSMIEEEGGQLGLDLNAALGNMKGDTGAPPSDKEG